MVGIEPEPGCVIETVEEAVDRLGAVDRDRIGVCLDLCHLAVGFDDADRALRLLDDAGLRVVKAQPASALVVDDPADAATRRALASYAEDRFLHQVRQVGAHGDDVAGRDDLARGPRRPRPARHRHALARPLPRAGARRPGAAAAQRPRDELHASLAALLGGPVARVDHLEVETYTWSVLPGGAPTDDDALAAGLAAELAWVHAELVALGLTPL